MELVRDSRGPRRSCYPPRGSHGGAEHASHCSPRPGRRGQLAELDVRRVRARRWRSRERRSPSIPTTSAASSPGRRGRKPASGSSPKRATCRSATSRASSPTIAAASSCPICRRRTTRCGRAATGWWTAPRPRPRPDSSSTSPRLPAPSEAAAAHYYPAIYWYSMLKIPAADQFGGKSSIPARLTQTPVDQRDEEHRLHRLPSARPAVHADHSRRRSARSPPAPTPGGGACSRARRGSMMFGQLTGLGDAAVRQLRRLDRSHREGRAAVRQAAAAAGRRAQHRRHAARLDEREAVPPRSDLERSPLSRRSTPTVRSSARPSTARTSCRFSIR